MTFKRGSFPLNPSRIEIWQKVLNLRHVWVVIFSLIGHYKPYYHDYLLPPYHVSQYKDSPYFSIDTMQYNL